MLPTPTNEDFVMDNQAEKSSERPYRSHLQPACLACRRRKSRCRPRDGSDTCAMCQVHDTSCVFPHSNAGRRVSAISARRAAAVARHTDSPNLPDVSLDETTVADTRAEAPEQSDLPCYPQEPPTFSEHHRGDRATTAISTCGLSSSRSPFTSADVFIAGGTNTSHIIGPTSADDSDALERYLSTITNSGGRPVIRMNASSNTSTRQNRPVLFNAVLSRPLGTSKAQSIGLQKCEIIEKFLEPNSKDLVSL